jgi:hypothetical protein
VDVDLIIAWWSIAFHKFGEHRRALQHVYVIVRFRHAKERMPKPEVIIVHSFKHHTAISMMPFCTNLVKQINSSSMTNACNRCFEAS